MGFNSFKEWFALCEQQGVTPAEIVLQNEMRVSECSREAVYDQLRGRWQVMEESARKALAQPQGDTLISGQAGRQQEYAGRAGGLSGPVLNQMMAMALSASETNAAMGRVCAAPTAGACGILPAVLITARQLRQADDAQFMEALLVAGGVGALITKNATVSGAEGGCQAECGAAAAMAAAAVVAMVGGSRDELGNAVTIALMNCMGLVCDPIAGLVQVPCSYRNASQSVNALLSADLALAGQPGIITPDEAVKTMYKVGRRLPPELRETALGGIADTKTAHEIQKKIGGGIPNA